MYIIMNTTPYRVLAEEMKKLEVLTGSLATPLLDHKEYKMIQQIFQRVKDATMYFHVRTLKFI